jgi:hypothetical protein
LRGETPRVDKVEIRIRRGRGIQRERHSKRGRKGEIASFMLIKTELRLIVQIKRTTHP